MHSKSGIKAIRLQQLSRQNSFNGPHPPSVQQSFPPSFARSTAPLACIPHLPEQPHLHAGPAVCAVPQQVVHQQLEF